MKRISDKEILLSLGEAGLSEELAAALLSHAVHKTEVEVPVFQNYDPRVLYTILEMPNGAKVSRKVENIGIYLPKTLEILGFTGAGVGAVVLTSANPIAGILTQFLGGVGRIFALTEITIRDDEARVLLALYDHAGMSSKGVPEAEVLDVVNRFLVKGGRGEISKRVLDKSLQILRRLRCIDILEGAYIVIEEIPFYESD